MGTVIFDFDSTVIREESLEGILASKWRESPQLEQQVRAITDEGMAGKITFAQSLERRLKLAAPSLDEVRAFGERAFELLTPDLDQLIAWLMQRDVRVHIASGGLYEAILPTALRLGIPAEQVHAVRLLWAPDGAFMGIDPQDPFSRAKVEGMRPWLGSCSAPRIMVGDGMTDYHVFRDGHVHHFVAFTQHIRRQAIIDTGAPEAADVAGLRHILEKLIWQPESTP